MYQIKIPKQLNLVIHILKLQSIQIKIPIKIISKILYIEIIQVRIKCGENYNNLKIKIRF
jgi:hypothetical protein